MKPKTLDKQGGVHRLCLSHLLMLGRAGQDWATSGKSRLPEEGAILRMCWEEGREGWREEQRGRESWRCAKRAYVSFMRLKPVTYEI